MRLSKYHTVLDDDDDERKHVNRNQENAYSTSRHHLDQISYLGPAVPVPNPITRYFHRICETMHNVICRDPLEPAALRYS